MQLEARDAVVLGAVRTRTGKGGATGQLASLHPVDLLAETIRGAIDRTRLPGDAVDDVIADGVTQVGEQSSNVARSAALAAFYGLQTVCEAGGMSNAMVLETCS